jgi:regulator of sigma E protease
MIKSVFDIGFNYIFSAHVSRDEPCRAKRYPWYQAPVVGLIESVKISVLYYQELLKIIGQLFTGHKPSVEVTGPVGIAKLTNEAVQSGFGQVIQLLGLLSLNLGLINLVPFPALDGGQLVFVLAEGLTRKKINEELKGKINALGFAVLIGLIILVTIQDLLKLFR